MTSISAIQNDFWAKRSLGDDINRDKLPKTVAQRLLSHHQDQVQSWKEMDNGPLDSDPRDGFVQYSTDYWADPSTTARKMVQVHLQGERVEVTHTREGQEKPFEYFSAEMVQGQLTSLSLIPGNASIWALASFVGSQGESYRDRKEFL